MMNYWKSEQSYICIIILLHLLAKVNCLWSSWEEQKHRMYYNPDCNNAIRDRGLVKSLFRETGDLDIQITEIIMNFTVIPDDTADVFAEEGKKIDITLMSCLRQDDPQLSKIIREQFLQGPASRDLNYNLSVPIEVYLDEKSTDVTKEVDERIFKGKLKNGFFIEAGANDFEDRSDSIYFEAKHGWSGLLVEPNYMNYNKGVKKNRKAHHINVCLSPVDWGTTLLFNSLRNHIEAGNTRRTLRQIEVTCLPIFSILQALGNPTVHYFSLDVEGSEFPILKTIPWDKVDIWVFSIETHFAGELYPGSREEIIQYMESQGYDHIPDGHKNDEFYYFTEEEITVNVINDMFVKRGLNLDFQ